MENRMRGLFAELRKSASRFLRMQRNGIFPIGNEGPAADVIASYLLPQKIKKGTPKMGCLDA
jgi:hypothetical protein